ncbi:MAG TPA: serpin family protein, partial [Candidatus Thermoplasmatota archaeon]|nr:serpin family protein [Candidatus Thermoplasmatota archaeon]
LAEANARFALRLARALAEEDPDANLLASPFSVSAALAMAYEAATNETRVAMARALGVETMTDEAFSASWRALHANLSDRRNVTLDVANAFWLDDAFAPRVKPGFAQRLAEYHRSEAIGADFRDPATVDRVNAWASEKTRGKIPEILDEIEPDEIAFLMNAVYFNGSWAREFNATCTRDAPFTRADGSTVTVRMMCGAPEKTHTYAKAPNATVVRAPYADDRLAMYAILPDAGATPDGLLAAWSGATLADALDAARRDPAILEMPRLDLKTRYDLRQALSALGMGIAFTDAASFERMAEGLYLSRVTHDALLVVDERGTVAAAVTNVGVGVTSAPPPPLRVVVDRPYLLAIRDDATGAILFLGKVVDPTAE